MCFLEESIYNDGLYTYSAIILLTSAHYSDKFKIRSVFIYACYFLLVIGYAINISDASGGAKYFGTFLVVVGSYSAFPGVVSWWVSVFPFQATAPEAF